MKFIQYVFLAFLLFGCTSSVSEETAKSDANDRQWLDWESCSQNIGDHPCNFSLKDQRGDEIELYDFYGEIIVVDLSVMWCSPCIAMAQASDSIVALYGEDKVEWLTLIIENQYGDPPSEYDLNSWASSNSVTSHVLATDRSIIDATGENGYPVSGWPTFVVIDQEMVLRYGTVGWSEEILKSQISSLIQ